MNLMDIYLHKPSGVRYALVKLSGKLAELHGISGAPRCVSVALLGNADIWQKC